MSDDILIADQRTIDHLHMGDGRQMRAKNGGGIRAIPISGEYCDRAWFEVTDADGIVTVRVNAVYVESVWYTKRAVA